MTERKPLAILPVVLLIPLLVRAALPSHSGQQTVFGYADFTQQAKIEEKFLAVPDARLAGEALKTLTAEPHIASTPQDRKTAEFVAEKFRAAGLDTEIVPYRVLMNQPRVVKVEVFRASGELLMSGPAREHVEGDPFEDNPGVVMPFNGSSGSGDVTGEVVYANYGRLVAEQKFEPAGFALRLGLKDVRLVLEAADELAVPMPLASLIRDHCLSAIAHGQAEQDWSSVTRVAARDAGLE